MDRLRESGGIVLVAFVFLFFVIPILLVSTLLPLLNDYQTYFSSFTLGSSEYSEKVVEQKYKELLTYIFIPTISGNNLDTEFFSREDTYHLQDVRAIYTFLYILIIVCVVILIWSAIDRKRKMAQYKHIKDSNRVIKITITLVLFISLLAGLFWTPAFTLFHKLLFPNNTYWLLDPTSSNLIKYFSEQFFQLCLAVYLFLLLIEYAIFQLFIRWTKRKEY